MAKAKASSATNTKSVQDARRRLTKFIKKVQVVPSEVLEEEAQTIYAEAIAETPYRSGKLEKSVYVRVSKDKRRPGLVAGASARSKGVNYAGIQHENTEFRHPIKGKAKYISDPFNRGTERIKKKMRERMRYGR